MTTALDAYDDDRHLSAQIKVTADLEQSHGFSFAVAFLVEHGAAIVRASNALAVVPVTLGDAPPG